MNSLISKSIFTLVVMTNLSVHAQTVNKSAIDKLSKARAAQSAKGGVATGGGDLCEDRIKDIRDDLKLWIVKGGAKSLNLPDGVSAARYSDDMLEQIYVAKIRCVGNGDAGYPVAVNGVAKVCRFDRTNSLSLITCDFSKFQATNEADQYKLVHHEYAGLADIERPNGSDSDYRISNQITQSLENVTLKRLVIKSSFGMKEIPTENLQGYIATAISSLKELNDKIGLEQEPYLCKKSTFREIEDPCGHEVPDDFFHPLGLKSYQFGRVGRNGSLTEVAFDTVAEKREKRTIRIVYDRQKVRTFEVIVYQWDFPRAVDIANPPTQKEWVKEGVTTWSAQ